MHPFALNARAHVVGHDLPPRGRLLLPEVARKRLDVRPAADARRRACSAELALADNARVPDDAEQEARREDGAETRALGLLFAALGALQGLERLDVVVADERAVGRQRALARVLDARPSQIAHVASDGVVPTDRRAVSVAVVAVAVDLLARPDVVPLGCLVEVARVEAR